ncbi:MAG: Zn-dependent hydrolase [Armatimonadetes bacterium]|nr:Zn-dependent hydrolase [Anaerolineae bacterium]
MDIPNLTINPDRLWADFEQLAHIGATPEGGVHRLALSNADLQARTWFAGQVDAAGLTLCDDAAGNLSAILPSLNPNAKTLLIGSHLDSVPNGGCYDGSVGVLAALECLRVVQASGVALPVHLEAINFTDQEGCWQGLFGSKALTGKLSPLSLNGDPDQHDDNNQKAAFRAALQRAGIHPSDVQQARRQPASVAGYLELHIEQGARLDRHGAHIGIVTGIVGRSTYEITFLGEASHSGTTAPQDRRDALQAAAHFIQIAHTRFSRNAGAFNCGNLRVLPGAFNIIPAQAVLTVEVRHPDEAQLRGMEKRLLTLARKCAERYHLTCSTEQMVHMPAAPMSEQFQTWIASACQHLGISDSLPLISYAGHDAQMLSSFTPSGMIFIPSQHGISHNPKEYTEWADVVLGANVLLHTVLRVALSV